MIVEYEHPEAGKVRLPGNPIKMSGMGKTIFESGAAPGGTYRACAAGNTVPVARRNPAAAR
jgi:hypothetical protein